MLVRISLLALTAPRRVLAAAFIVTAAAAIFGLPVANSLSGGGFLDPTSESARASRELSDKFGQGDQRLQITVTASARATGHAARTVGTDIVNYLRKSPHVTDINSPWTSPPAVARKLISTDEKTGLIVAALTGGENDAPKFAKEIIDELTFDRDGVTVRFGGVPVLYSESNSQSKRDMVLMESIALPVSFAALVWVFGGVAAAVLPVTVGVMAIAVSMALLRLITFMTDASIFALNLIAAMSLALAIDYTLLIISRYRDELANGAADDEALIRTMCTAGRTVLFSACTVALSVATAMLFPMYLLRTFAYAGLAAIAFSAFFAVTVTPATIVMLGPRLNSWDVRRLGRRLLQRSEPTLKPVQDLFWYRSTKLVMRHALPIGLAVTALLILLGSPFLGIRLGLGDDRMLPTTANARQVGDILRTDFADNSSTTVPVVITDAAGLTLPDIERYAADLSRVHDVLEVSAPTGTFIDGIKTGPPSTATGIEAGSALLTVSTAAPLFSDASTIQLDMLHGVPTPGDRKVLMTGFAQVNRDVIKAIISRLPLTLGLIGIVTFGLLFILTGSLVLPLKAIFLNALSLTAAFGALVWVFQQGHFGALGTTPTGTVVAIVPVLMFVLAFGLSMDYEVFLLSRIREYWAVSDGCNVDNEESVALGLAHTGRVITAAALLMSISFASLVVSQVSYMRMFGLGLTIAVLVDATLVRMILVPAFMKIFGRWNWWAPRPLARLHQRIGIAEAKLDQPTGAAAGPSRQEC